MRVLFAAARPCYPLFLGGAEISIHETLTTFRQHGHECLAVGQVTLCLEDLTEWLATHSGQIHTRDRPIANSSARLVDQWEVALEVGYPVRLTLHADFLGCLRRQLHAFGPDLVFTQLEGSELVAREAVRMGLRVCHTIRDLDNPHNFLPFLSPRTARTPIVTLVASHYVQEQVMARWGVASHVVPPVVEGAALSCLTPQDPAVVMVNPMPSKGRDIVRYLIAHLPNLHFVLVEGWSSLHRADWPCPNVRLVRRCHDLGRILAGASMVLVPSQAEEAFGRVVVEAQAAGVPVLASRHSGLIEAQGNGDGMVEEYRDPEAWRSLVVAVLHDPARREAMRQHGLANAQRFTRERHWKRLKEVLLR